MVKNYLLSALRSLLQRKSLLALNIFGFSLGLSSALLMFAFCWDEIGYDTYHPDHDRLYRVALTRYFPDRQNSYATSPPPLGPTMYHEFPEVIDFCRVFDSGNETRIRLDDRVFYEERLFAADSSFFTLFGVRLLAGNPREALSTPNAVVITEEISKKYFGNSQALNQTLEIGDTTKFVVKGIAENVPKRSHFKFDLLISLRSLPIADNNFWGSYSIHNYVKLDEQDNVASVTDKIPALLEARMGPQVENILGKTYKEYVEAGNIHDFFLQPIKDIHLKSQFTNELDVNGDWKYVLLFFYNRFTGFDNCGIQFHQFDHCQLCQPKQGNRRAKGDGLNTKTAGYTISYRGKYRFATGGDYCCIDSVAPFTKLQFACWKRDRTSGF